MSSRRDEEFADLLDDLEWTLDELRAELRDRGSGGRTAGRREANRDRDSRQSGERRSDRVDRSRRTNRPRRSRRSTRPRESPFPLPPRPPEPPRIADILRFTDEYTIPTVIAILEANIQALRLLQRLLRLGDPARAVRDSLNGGYGDDARNRIQSVRDGAVDGLDRTLSELQRALSESDLPDDPDSRSIIEDARDLSTEIERRIDESRRESRPDDERRREQERENRRRNDRGRRPERSRRSGRTGSIEISVDEEQNGDIERDARADAADEDDEEPEVDVDAEIESIKEELGKFEGDVDDAGVDGDVDDDAAGGDDDRPNDDGDDHK